MARSKDIRPSTLTVLDGSRMWAAIGSRSRLYARNAIYAGVAGAVAFSLAMAPSIAQADDEVAWSVAQTERYEADTPSDNGDSPSADAKDSDEEAVPENLYGNEKIEVDILAEKLKTAESTQLTSRLKSYAAGLATNVLKAQLPEQEERSNEAARTLYKMHRDRFTTADMLLSAETLDEFIRHLDYLDSVTQANVETIVKTREMKQEAAAAEKSLKKAGKIAEKQKAAIEDALESAQAKRVARAEEGIAESKRQAAEIGGKKSVGKDGNGDKQPKSAREAATNKTEALDAGADWTMSKEEFVAEWAPRIDRYLKGSPLYGQGENFAKSAWKYGIDPRWSAAISNTESSKGTYCIRPHNAWGWGAADSDPYNLALEWDSWAEAIDAHAKGLSEGYGYTISMRGAKAYCPYTWQHWYNSTLNQMSQI